MDRNRSPRAAALFMMVALRKESVDRNIPEKHERPLKNGRSPQGERG